MLEEVLKSDNVHDIIGYLADRFKNNERLSADEMKLLLKFEREDGIQDCSLLGVIGLHMNNHGRILLGRMQPYYPEIRKWCDNVDISREEIIEIAASYMDEDYTDENYTGEPEIVFRLVASEYLHLVKK